MGSGETSSDSKQLSQLAYIQLEAGNAPKAVELFKSAAEKARGEGDVDTIISCYLNAGACLVSRDQLQQGSTLLHASLKLAKEYHATESHATDGKESTTGMEITADINFNLAVAEKKMGNIKNAKSYFKTSVDLYLKSDSVVHAAEGLTGLAGCYRKRREPGKEITCLVRAQVLYHEQGEGYHEAECCLELARTYLREKQMENCKEILSTAKLLCLRIDHCSLKGKLYSQFGLIYSSMGLYDLGIQNFERALPLVRESIATHQSLQAEASLLQNIGAAYNEQALYLEAMVFHKEAATIHGKVKNYNSECKSLCNLAFAQTQLNQFQEAAISFSNALARAHLAKNLYLEFQTCEGLGCVHHQMGSHGEAAGNFQQALAILDHIKEDTGIARERIMEKLSEVSETPGMRGGHTPLPRQTPGRLGGSGDHTPQAAHTEDTKQPSITERRGVKLAPIKQPHTHKQADSAKMQRDSDDHSDYSTQLQAYMDSYAQGSQSSMELESRDGQIGTAASRHMDKQIATPTVQVREGSLAIGPNARENFTIQTIEEWSKGKKGKTKRQRRSEIVPTSDVSPGNSPANTQQQQGISRPQQQDTDNDTDTQQAITSPQHTQPAIVRPQHTEGEERSSRLQSTNHSKVCTIL